MKTKVLLTSIIMATVIAITGCSNDKNTDNNNVNSNENTVVDENKTADENKTEVNKMTVDDMYNVYTEANKVIDNAEAIELKASVDMKISPEGQEAIETKTSSTVKKVKKSDNDFNIELTINTDSMGTPTPVEIHGFYTNGYLYAELLGQKIKQALSLEEALEQAKTKVFEFPKEAIKESNVTDLGDGQTQLDIVLDPETTKSIMSNYLKEAGGAAFTENEDALGIKEVSISAKLDKDNNFITNNIKFKGSLTLNEQTADLDMNMDTEVINIGESVIIELPSDLDSYVEAPAQ